MNVLFEWNDALCTGIDSVDQQHHHLVELINGLAASLVDGTARDQNYVHSIHAVLLEYASTHFAEEDRLMVGSAIDPRHIAYHQSQHQFFVQQLATLPLQGDDTTARMMLRFLVDWLAHHILGLDRSLARLLSRVTSRPEPEPERDRLDSDPLLQAINVMFKVVAERNRELQAANEQLEQRVAERTAELTRANQQLSLLALNDELTGLPNRRFAMSMLSELWPGDGRRGASMAVLMLDADHFKNVNDRFGHGAGDDMLRELAKRLREAVRGSDVVCRYGGDEFLVVCPRCDRQGALLVANKIVEASGPMYRPDGEFCWDGSLSIGVAIRTDAMHSPDELLQVADQALYRAKHEGGRRIECA